MAANLTIDSESHGLVLTGNKTVCAVGENNFGHLGHGTTMDRYSPVATAGLANTAGIATSWYHSLAVLSDGTVWSWGYNNTGQLGDGTFTSRSTPALVPGLGGMTAVAVGQFHSLALKNDGTVKAQPRPCPLL